MRVPGRIHEHTLHLNSHRNGKTVIRQTIYAEAKLGNTENAGGIRDAPYLVPNPSNRVPAPQCTCAGFSVANGQIGYDPRREASLSYVGTNRSRSTTETAVRPQRIVRSGVIEGYDVSVPQTVGTTAHPGRQHPSAGHVHHGRQ